MLLISSNSHSSFITYEANKTSCSSSDVVAFSSTRCCVVAACGTRQTRVEWIWAVLVLSISRRVVTYAYAIAVTASSIEVESTKCPFVGDTSTPSQNTRELKHGSVEGIHKADSRMLAPDGHHSPHRAISQRAEIRYQKNWDSHRCAGASAGWSSHGSFAGSTIYTGERREGGTIYKKNCKRARAARAQRLLRACWRGAGRRRRDELLPRRVDLCMPELGKSTVST
ncbi:uncharacterized protein V1518DRAFT_421211 [Limtongia smithiae]|uniref:uncharacterized protein n=1 Tax=Limtongia smithiae TaxID=1125753 RepID=UPI0034CED701